MKNKLNKARELIKEKPYLLWYTKNYDNLSLQSILEAITSYGDWDDFLELKKILGTKTLYEIFKKVKARKRPNVRPQTINYFEKYFRKYAQ